MRFAIYGTGGFGRDVATIAPEAIFVDDSPERPSRCNGRRVIGFDELAAHHRDRQVVIAIADGRVRRSVEQKCREAGLTIGSVCAPSARVYDGVEIGEGAIVCDNVLLTSNASIGRGFHANAYSYIGHDCVVGDYVTLGPRASVNGNIEIGDFAYIGTGAMFAQGRQERPLAIGEGAFIAMGAVVTKPVLPYTMVAGNPARLVKTLRNHAIAAHPVASVADCLT